MAARFDFEAKLGPPRTADVVVKGETHRLFRGVPTVRGALVVRELSHVDGPDDAVIELQWGYGSSSEPHFEKDEVGMAKKHADALRALLVVGDKIGHDGHEATIDDDDDVNIDGASRRRRGSTVRSAVVAMLREFVADFEREMPEPRPRLNEVSPEAHADAVAADVASRGALLGLGADVSDGAVPDEPALAPWEWERPRAPDADFGIDPDSKLGKLHGLQSSKSSSKDAKGGENDKERAERPPENAAAGTDEARGGFNHGMMEKLESLTREGYTVLLPPKAAKKDKETKAGGVQSKKNPPPPRKSEHDDDANEASSRSASSTVAAPAARPGTVDYSKFDALDLSDDDDDEEDDEVEEVEAVRQGDEAELEAALARRREAKIKKLGSETSALWEAILEIAGGDHHKAQELMQDPDRLMRDPRIAKVYRDDKGEEELPPPVA